MKIQGHTYSGQWYDSGGPRQKRLHNQSTGPVNTKGHIKTTSGRPYQQA